MASNLGAVGFHRDEIAEVQKMLSVAFDRAEEAGNVVEHAEGKTLRYVDPSGATLTIHVDRGNSFECFQPGFASEARFWWRPEHVVPDHDGCRFCDRVYAEFLGDDAGNEMYYPVALTVETMGADRALTPFGETGEFAFAGLCREGQVWGDEAEYERELEAEPWSEEIRGFASRSLIPSGTFADDGAWTSDVVAHGVVTSVEERENELGGSRFLLVKLETLGGTFDTCVAPGTLEREELLAPGAVVGARLTLFGRPLTLRDAPRDVPTAERESKGLGRLFRRRKR